MSNNLGRLTREKAIQILCDEYNYDLTDFEGMPDYDIFDTLSMMQQLKDMPDQA